MICALLAPMALSICALPPPKVVTPSVTVPIGRWTRLGRSQVRADRVLEDSRCPMNARCAWAGRAIVRLTIRENGRTRRADVTLGESTRYSGGRLALVAVAPERMAGAQPKRPPPYRFTFEYIR